MSKIQNQKEQSASYLGYDHVTFNSLMKKQQQNKQQIQKDESKSIRVKKTAKFAREMKPFKSVAKPNISSPRRSTSGI